MARRWPPVLFTALLIAVVSTDWLLGGASSPAVELESRPIIEASEPVDLLDNMGDPVIATQLGIDWLMAATCDWMTSPGTVPDCTTGQQTSCFGCHVQAESILGLARSSERCYTIPITPCVLPGDESPLQFAARQVAGAQRKACIIGPYSPACSATGGSPTDPTTRDGYPPDLGSIGLFPNCGAYGLPIPPAPVMQTVHGGLTLAGYAEYVSPTYSGNLLDLADWLVTKQEVDGSWAADRFEPPVDQGDPFTTGSAVMSLLGARMFGNAAQTVTYDAAVQAAEGWTRTAPLVTNQDHAFALVTLQSAGVTLPDVDLELLRTTLLGQQLADGGWAERPGLQSNAYATGQSVHALVETGSTFDDPEICAGVGWLVDEQNASGSWSIGAQGTSTDSTRNSDFTATIWPVLALGSIRPFGADSGPPQVVASCEEVVEFTVMLTNTADSVCGQFARNDTYDLTVVNDSGDLVRVNPAVVSMDAGVSVPVTVTWERAGPPRGPDQSVTTLRMVSQQSQLASCSIESATELTVDLVADSAVVALDFSYRVTKAGRGQDLVHRWALGAQAVGTHQLVDWPCPTRLTCTQDPTRTVLDARAPLQEVDAVTDVIVLAGEAAIGGPGLIYYKVRPTTPCLRLPAPTCNFTCTDDDPCHPGCP